MDFLPCETIETTEKITASVIWLHGLGANGHDFIPIVPMLDLPKNLGIRFVFPHAPSIPVTINAGMVMPAWYDILAIGTEREIDNTQILQSASQIIDLVEREITRGVNSKRIILAGFSQGGAVCYQAALSYEKPLAGLMALSTYFATHKTITPNRANASLPIHLFHGNNDDIVPEKMGLDAQRYLESMGYHPSYNNYSMAHEVIHKEIADISAWLQNLLQ